MILMKPCPWWKFWPVICWRHRQIVPKDDICPICALLRPFRNVYLLTTGDGEDGNQWDVFAIYATREAAERAKVEFDRISPCASNPIEEWEVK